MSHKIRKCYVGCVVVVSISKNVHLYGETGDEVIVTRYVFCNTSLTLPAWPTIMSMRGFSNAFEYL